LQKPCSVKNRAEEIDPLSSAAIAISLDDAPSRANNLMIGYGRGKLVPAPAKKFLRYKKIFGIFSELPKTLLPDGGSWL